VSSAKLQAQQLPAAEIQQPIMGQTIMDTIKNSIGGNCSSNNDSHPTLQQLRSLSKGLAATTGAPAAERSAAEPEIQPLLDEP
jgi:hypothetical protein